LVVVSISSISIKLIEEPSSKAPKGRKWVRKWTTKPTKRQFDKVVAQELRKRHLVEVVVFEGTLEDMRGGEKKKNRDVQMTDFPISEALAVLEDQRHQEP
jgi:hypothetical protein